MGQTCYLSVILQAMVHNPMMRNYFLSSRHDSTECEIDNCVSCALTISFSDILATEKLDGHGPVDLLYRSWKHNNVSDSKSSETSTKVHIASCGIPTTRRTRILSIIGRPLTYVKQRRQGSRRKKLQLSLSQDLFRPASKYGHVPNV